MYFLFVICTLAGSKTKHTKLIPQADERRCNFQKNVQPKSWTVKHCMHNMGHHLAQDEKYWSRTHPALRRCPALPRPRPRRGSRDCRGIPGDPKQICDGPHIPAPPTPAPAASPFSSSSSEVGRGRDLTSSCRPAAGGAIRYFCAACRIFYGQT